MAIPDRIVAQMKARKLQLQAVLLSVVALSEPFDDRNFCISDRPVCHISKLAESSTKA